MPKVRVINYQGIASQQKHYPCLLTSHPPELNPVELCFNFLRQNTEKKKPRTYEELKISINKAIKILEKEDLTKWFQHCWDYFKEKEKKDNEQVERMNVREELKTNGKDGCFAF